MKRVLCASVLVCLLFVLAIPLQLKAAEPFPYPSLSVSVNPSNVQLYGVNIDAPELFEKDGITWVPFRAVAEAMGATVDWDDTTRTVTSEYNFSQISVVADGINAIIKGNKAYVPYSFLDEMIKSYHRDIPGIDITEDMPVYSNEEFGFSLAFPASWKDKYTVMEFEGDAPDEFKRIEIRHKPTVEEMGENLGVLFNIVRYPGEYTDPDRLVQAGGCIILANSNGYCYFYQGVSDVEFNTDPDSVTGKEYQEMVNQYESVLSSFRLLGDSSSNTYPENFLSLSGEEFIDFDTLEPKELYSWEGANGTVRILDYGIEIVYELEYADEKHHLDTGYVDESFITSEGISTGSTRAEVLAAYKEYGITNVADGYGGIPRVDRELEAILKNGLIKTTDDFAYRWLHLVKALCERENNIDTENLLSVDNGTPEGIEQFGGLGALIFVFDNTDILKMIIWTAPTSG